MLLLSLAYDLVFANMMKATSQEVPNSTHQAYSCMNHNGSGVGTRTFSFKYLPFVIRSKMMTFSYVSGLIEAYQIETFDMECKESSGE